MTVGELKQWFIDNNISDDMPIWKLGTVEEHGCSYPNDFGTDCQVFHHTNEYGIVYPEGHPRRKSEVGVAIW